MLMGICRGVIIQNHLKGGAPREWSPNALKRLYVFDFASVSVLLLVLVGVLTLLNI